MINRFKAFINEKLEFSETLLAIRCITNITSKDLKDLGKKITKLSKISEYYNRVELAKKIYNFLVSPDSEIEKLKDYAESLKNKQIGL